MENLNMKIKNQNKSPTRYGIKILILFCFFMFISFNFISRVLKIFITINELISNLIILILCEIISILLLNLIFKNFKIYKTKNLFKTLKISSPYLIYLFFILMYEIYNAINKKISFRSVSEILLYVFALITISGFVTDSIFNGLILNSFTKKYLDKPHGIFKILIFPNLFLLIPILCFYIIEKIDFTTVNCNLEKAICQVILIFFVKILTTAIYLRGGNIFVLILVNSMIYTTIYFKYGFLKILTFNDNINQFNYLNLIYIPICLLLAIFLLRKSKLEEVKENLKKINQI